MHWLSTFPRRAAFAGLREARPPPYRYEATSGFAARYGPSLCSHRFAPDGILAPLLLDASRRHAGDRTIL